MFQRLTVFFTLIVLASILIVAQEKKSAEITGYLVDNMCVTGKVAKDKEHSTACALSPNCQKSGFAVVSNDHTLKLDEKGNELALAILKNTKVKKGLTVVVHGTVKDDTLFVEDMSESHQ